MSKEFHTFFMNRIIQKEQQIKAFDRTLLESKKEIKNANRKIRFLKKTISLEELFSKVIIKRRQSLVKELSKLKR